MEIIVRALLDLFLLFVAPIILGLVVGVVVVMWRVHVKKERYDFDGDAAEASRAKELWSAAGMTLANDPSARVACPECGTEFLQVEDATYPKVSRRADRYITCPSCRALRVLPAVAPESSSPP